MSKKVFDWKRIAIIAMALVILDLIGDWLWRKGVPSIYIKGIHIEHELIYLILPTYILLKKWIDSKR